MRDRVLDSITAPFDSVVHATLPLTLIVSIDNSDFFYFSIVLNTPCIATSVRMHDAIDFP
jgi:hypothetical protein